MTKMSEVVLVFRPWYRLKARKPSIAVGWNKALWRPLVGLMLVLCSFTAYGMPVSGQGAWETTLQARDLNGDNVVDAYYDTALNITWLASWNSNGTMNWNNAMAWAAGLNIYGLTGWRLPTTTDTGLLRVPV